jgi:hypothetical protein
MARPRVFVSSTYYDLKHLRSSLENFIDSLGFDAILSEKGDVAYAPDRPLDESCYREVENSDVLVLIVGGRYGSEISETKGDTKKSFFERYNSITRSEYQSAVRRGIPIYILIERSVHAEYETYLRNKESKKVRYAHVDSINIFVLIEEILNQPRNNPVQQFERYSEIEAWLREQWAGLFRELLRRMQGQAEIASLQAQVGQLSELNTTLKRYLEEIVSRIAPQKESETLIRSETQRLMDASLERALSRNQLGKYLVDVVGIPPSDVFSAIRKATSADGFVQILADGIADKEKGKNIRNLTDRGTLIDVEEDLEDMRRDLQLAPLKVTTNRWRDFQPPRNREPFGSK